MSIRQYGRDHRGTHHLFRSRFHDIVDGERIVVADDMLHDGRLTSMWLTTVELRPNVGSATHVFGGEVLA